MPRFFSLFHNLVEFTLSLCVFLLHLIELRLHLAMTVLCHLQSQSQLLTTLLQLLILSHQHIILLTIHHLLLTTRQFPLQFHYLLL